MPPRDTIVETIVGLRRYPMSHRWQQGMAYDTTPGGGVPVVATGILSAPVPGLWRRLSLISADGTITGLASDRLIGQLEDVGIPRHQHAVAHLLLSWQRARIPPDVALALWLLREQEDGNGRIYRRAGTPVLESSPAIRYIQLAAAVGETRETDPTLHRVVSWLLDRQLADGSIPLSMDSRYGETGQTARTLRALHGLRDPELADRLKEIATFLRTTARPQETGAAWAYSTVEQTVVTGSTSLAVTALIEYGVTEQPVPDGLGYLLASQEPDGGWAEVPGYRSTFQNTFQVVRALRTAQHARVGDPAGIAAALARAEAWFRRAARRTPRSLLDHIFAVRTATQLGLLTDPPFEAMARRLGQRRRRFLDPAGDMYADTELAAIALLEASTQVDVDTGNQAWRWRWRLPAPTPPFLVRGAYFYELLYGMVRARWWVRFVDELVDRRIVDRAAGLMLGAVTSIGLIDDYVVNALATRSGVSLTIIGLLLVIWFGIKAAARSSILEALRTSGDALLAAAVMGVVVDAQGQPGLGLAAVVMLRWLVVDVVAFTADSTGLLDRLLPKS